MDYLFCFYGALAILHIVYQLYLGMKHQKLALAQRRAEMREVEENGGYESFTPDVAVFMPVYNEEPDILREALLSLKNQRYGGKLRFYVIDDGSKNGEEISKVFAEFDPKEENEVQRFYFKRIENMGKRVAQYNALSLMEYLDDKSEIIVTIDSDTVIARDGIQNLVRAFKDEKIGAATGQVFVSNNWKNLLTELIGYRYWMAFNQERAAQSYFRVLMCCSGPFSAIRRSIFEDVAWQYINQTFLGKKCTYGDDRHLTNLVLEKGHDVVYRPFANAYTQVPETPKRYIKQQVRWNKSFYREMLWTLKSIKSHHWYLLYDLAMQFILPFLLTAAVIHMFYLSFTDGWKHLLAYLAVMVLIGLLRVSYALFRTKNLRFLKFLGYGLFHVFILLPVRFYAILTLRDGRWWTR